MKKRILTLLLCMTAIAAAAASARAQTSLPTLPESDALLFINGRRVINEALPRVLPEQIVSQMRSGIEQVKNATGIDIGGTDVLVVALRFRNMSPANPMPDILIALRGSFKSDALLSLARMGLQGKYREEKYGTKTITVLKLAEMAGPKAKLPPFLSELSFFASDANTLIGGTNQYVKAAIDATEGKGLISPELSALAMRDPSALLSIAALIPPGFFTNFIPKEMQSNQEMMKLIAGINQAYGSIGMGATDFPITLSVRTADAEHARSLAGLVEMGAGLGAAGVKEKPLQDLLRSVKVTVSGTEVQAQASIPQEVVAGFLKNMFVPTKPPVAPEKKP